MVIQEQVQVQVQVCVCVCVFGARHLVEKAYEYNSEMFLLFVDLRKAYDSIPRQAMWKVLAKYGVAQVIINLLRSLHEGMRGQVMVGGKKNPPDISQQWPQTGGCTIAPTLFNLFFNLVIEQWHQQYQALGVEVLYKCSGRLVGARTRSPAHTLVSQLLFADDACAVTTLRAGMEQAVEVLLRVTSQWELTVSIPKTKLMVVCEGLQEDAVAPISTDNGVNGMLFLTLSTLVL